ncbi:MAG: hypothetical protein LBH71_00655, partial [Oscillospiraceae bacterium]|nr:hypothetical protein [Oscillospiraceae bacterium]
KETKKKSEDDYKNITQETTQATDSHKARNDEYSADKMKEAQDSPIKKKIKDDTREEEPDYSKYLEHLESFDELGVQSNDDEQRW